MSTIYMSCQLSSLPLMEGDQDRGLFPAFHIAKDPPILFPFMINSPVDQHQGQSYGDQHLRQQLLAQSSNQQFKDHVMIGGSSDVVFPTPSPFRPTIQSIGSDMIQRSTYDPYDIENKRADGSTSRWAVAPPAKMKIMRKATSEYPEGGAARKPRRRAQAHQDESQQQQQQQGIVRVCSDCNTTKTPLWRSGPCGPKSLCNACGIRQRKARRALAAAAAAAASSNGGAAVTVSVSQQTKQAKKEKRAEVDRSLPLKKRCKMVVVDQAATAAKAAPVVAAPTKDQDHVVTGDSVAAAPNLQSKGTTPPAMFHAFPADEITDAAMLLMTLSCGLVRS